LSPLHCVPLGINPATQEPSEQLIVVQVVTAGQSWTVMHGCPDVPNPAPEDVAPNPPLPPVFPVVVRVKQPPTDMNPMAMKPIAIPRNSRISSSSSKEDTAYRCTWIWRNGRNGQKRKERRALRWGGTGAGARDTGIATTGPSWKSLDFHALGGIGNHPISRMKPRRESSLSRMRAEPQSIVRRMNVAI